MSRSRGDRSRSSKNLMAPMTGRRLSSWMFSPPSVMARVEGLSRAPWQAGQGRSAMNSSILLRM